MNRKTRMSVPASAATKINRVRAQVVRAATAIALPIHKVEAMRSAIGSPTLVSRTSRSAIEKRD